MESYSPKIGKVEVFFIIALIAFIGFMMWLGDELLANPENILRNSAFTRCTNPNVPDYWGTAAPEYIEDWEDKYGVDEDSPIPGTMSLKITSPEANPAWHIQSFLYGGILSDKRYTFSVYLKADKEAFPVKLGFGSWYGNKWTTVMVGREWQRYSFTERPGTPDNRLAVRIALVEAGTLWIAAPKLELGQKATDYSVSKLDSGQMPIIPQKHSINIVPSLRSQSMHFKSLVELSYYTQEPTVRIWVQSNLSEPANVQVWAREVSSSWIEALKPLEGTRLPSQPIQKFLQFDITTLPIGRYEITTFAITDDGKILGETKDTLIKLPPSKNEVKVNRINRNFLVNNKAFLVYAQGIHGAKVDWWLDDIKSQGFNTVVAIFPAHATDEALSTDEMRIRTFLDECEERRLKVVFWMQPPGGDYKTIKDAVMRTINRFKDHPAILFWYLLDEPEGWWFKEGGKQESDLVDLYNAAKMADPYRPAHINWYDWTPGKGGYGSLNATDIGSLDRYPIGKVENAMKAVADIASLMNRDCRQRNMPTAFWVQMYGYDDAVREPTPEEERCMTYLCLIHGMRAVYYFIYKPMYSGLWESMAELGNEVKVLESILGSLEVRELVTDIVEDIHYSIWESGGKTYLLACNGGSDEVTVHFDLNNLSGFTFLKANVLFEGRELSIADGKFVDIFRPYERHIYEL